MVERNEALARFRVVEHALALGKRAPAGILTAQPHGFALQQQGAEGEGLGERPFEGSAVGEGFRATLQQAALELGQNFETVRDVGDGPHDALQLFRGDGGGHGGVGIRRLVNGLGAGEALVLALLALVRGFLGLVEAPGFGQGVFELF